MSWLGVSWRGAFVATGGALLIASCTSILGNDFEITSAATTAAGGSGGAGATGNPGGAGGTGGAGGAGGAVGGMGGTGGFPTFACDWVFEEHEELGSTEGTVDTLAEVIVMRRGPDHARVVALRRRANQQTLVVHTVSAIDARQTSTHPMNIIDIEHGLRLSPSDLGVVLTAPVAGGPSIVQGVVVVIGDSDPDGANLETYVFAPGTALESISSTAPARFQAAPISLGLDDWKLDFTASYATTSPDFDAYYGRYDPNTDTVERYDRITPAGGAQSANAVDPVGIFRVGSITHAFIGEESIYGYALDTSMPTLGLPRMVGGLSHGMGAVASHGNDYANISMFDTSSGIEFLVGRVDAGELATFTAADLNTALAVPDVGSLPIIEGGAAWIDNTLTMIGPDSDDGTDMAYWLADNAGRVRGEGALAFTATPMAMRNGIGRVDFAIQSESLDSTGVTIHVAWLDQQERLAATFDVLYYDQLRCEPIR